MQEKMIDYLKKTENPYMLKVRDMVVDIEYSKNGKKISECVQNVLKKKIGK